MSRGLIIERISALIDLYPVVLDGSLQSKPEDHPPAVRYVPDNIKEIIATQILDEAKKEIPNIKQLAKEQGQDAYLFYWKYADIWFKKWHGDKK